MFEVVAKARKHLLRFGFLSFIILCLASCSLINNKVGTAFNFDTDLKLSFKVDSNINLDENKNPSPLFIRLYELNSPKKFNDTDFITLYDRDKNALGADMVSKQRLKRLKPEEDFELKMVLNEETKYVGLYAEFLDYKDAKYKIVFPVVENNVIRTSVNIHVSGNKIILLD